MRKYFFYTRVDKNLKNICIVNNRAARLLLAIPANIYATIYTIFTYAYFIQNILKI